MAVASFLLQTVLRAGYAAGDFLLYSPIQPNHYENNVNHFTVPVDRRTCEGFYRIG